jgi:tetratricopeptide (TPR) repeat protein
VGSAPPPITTEISRLADMMNTARYAEAENLARTLLDRHPDLGFLWKVYGVALMRQAKHALPVLQRATQLLPDDAETFYYLGSALQDRVHLAGAMASYKRALELRPNYAEATVNMANVLRDCGRLDEAVAGYRRVLELQPELAEVHNNLGNAFLQLRQIDAAATSYRRALEIKPNFTAAHSNLGNALRSLGQPREALVSYRRALEIEPDFADAHNNLGNARLELGQADEAVQCYRRALEIQPNFADAHSNLGNALRDLGQLHEALASYRRALEIRPGLAEAHNNLGNVLLDLMQLSEAAASYRRALAIQPEYAHAHTALGMVLRQQGRTAEAEASCHRALDIEPDSAEVTAFLAEIRADQGQFAAADELFRQALAIDPNLPAAWAGIARYRRMSDGDPSWLAATQRLAGKGLPLRHEINLRYAIGKYFDDVKDYEQAFDSYRLANELTKRYGARYDKQQLTRLVDRIVASYDQKWLSQSRIQADRSERPVFVVGMPRSGTTLAEQILASHPAVFGAGELPFWNEAAAGYELSTPNGMASASKISALAVEYLRQLADWSADAARVVDKMPTNYVNLGLIHAALPEARIIHMRRNPIDTCLSIFFQNFSISHAYANDLEDLAHYYTEYLSVMEHWHATLPQGAILDVSYEGLVDDPETWSRRMLEFIGLPWDPRCLDFYRTNRTVITPSKWQVRQKINKSSSGRWRNYASFVGPLQRLMPLAHLPVSHSRT